MDIALASSPQSEHVNAREEVYQDTKSEHGPPSHHLALCNHLDIDIREGAQDEQGIAANLLSLSRVHQYRR